MKSVRLDPELEDRITRAAAARGETVSEFIRRAVAKRADETVEPDPLAAFADVLGVVHAGGGRARRTGEAFHETLTERKRR
jgi:predicted transcriptional regulator